MRYIRIDPELDGQRHPPTVADPFACDRIFQFVDIRNALAVGIVRGGSDTRIEKLPHHEFSILLHGAVTFEGTDGKRIGFKAGDSFVLPAGLGGRISACVNMKRSFLICGQDTGGSRIERPILVDPAASRSSCSGPSPELLLTPAPLAAAYEAFRSPNGLFQVGIWQCSGFDRRPALAKNYELMQIIEGDAALQNEGKIEEPFRRGQSVLIHPGTQYVLRAQDTFAKVYATVSVTLPPL